MLGEHVVGQHGFMGLRILFFLEGDQGLWLWETERKKVIYLESAAVCQRLNEKKGGKKGRCGGSSLWQHEKDGRRDAKTDTLSEVAATTEN